MLAPRAQVVKLVDTRDLKSLGLTAVPVRFRPWAPLSKINQLRFLLIFVAYLVKTTA